MKQTTSKNRKNLNICFLCKTFLRNRGGTEAYYLRMANALSARGHKVHLIVAEGEMDSYSKDLSKSVQLHIIKIKEDPFKGYWILDSFLPLTRLRIAWIFYSKLKEINKKQPIDIVQSPDWSSSGFIISFKKNIPLVIRLHGMPNYSSYLPVNTKKPNLKEYITWQMTKIMLRNATGISAVSKNFLDIVTSTVNLKNIHHIKVIHNGIDQLVYKPLMNVTKRNSVLFVGRLGKAKGAEVILKAAPLVIKKNPEIRFTFAGRETKFNENLTWGDHFRKLIPEKNIEFLGQVDTTKIVNCYSESLLAIFPSLYEPGGAAALESMACNCPVIATNNSGFIESIHNEVNGILIPPNDPIALSKAINTLLEDSNLRNKLSSEGLKTVSQKFNLENCINQSEDFYKQILEIKH